MNTRRWLSVAAVTVTSATLALAGAGSDALASNAAATGQIKACYKTGTTLVPLNHIGNSGKCPTGDTGLTWNKTGPPGPPGPSGVSVGVSATSGTTVSLDQANTLIPVLTSEPVPQSGTYYVNASIMLTVGQGDTVVCVYDIGGTETGAFATVGPVAGLSYQTLPLTGMLNLTAGDALSVSCSDYTSDAATSFYNGAITGMLINSATGNAQPAAPARHGLPSRP